MVRHMSNTLGVTTRGSPPEFRRPCGPSPSLRPVLLATRMSNTLRSGARPRLGSEPPDHRISRRGPLFVTLDLGRDSFKDVGWDVEIGVDLLDVVVLFQ